MKRTFFILITLGVLAAFTAHAEDEELDLVREALPEAVPAPKKAYKVLVYSRPWGFPHASIKIGKKTLQAMGEKTGLFEAVLSDDLDEFAPGNLDQYDAICLNNTTHLQKGFTKPEYRESLTEFVRNGGGLFAIHSATDGGWPEYTEMIGGNFDGHPWGNNGTWKIANEDPIHPILKGVHGGMPFLLRDELYQYKDFDRSQVRVLLSVDMSAFQNLSRGEKREDADYALAWIREYGKGRVFVSSLGHNKEVFYNSDILKMWVNGLRWVLGEMEADATSKPKPLATGTAESGQKREARVRSPEESMAEFDIRGEYSVEVVATEPLVDQPVLVVWDGNGRMYVAEMATYMNNIKGTDQLTNRSQVVRLEDTDGDGRMDKRVVFAKDLKLPRLILPLKERVLIGETDTNNIYAYRDINGDGEADEKELWWEGGHRGGNLEHQHSGLVWAMDNWIYTTRSNYRLRYTSGKVVKQTIPADQGQWGLTQDNTGTVIYVDAGSGRGPVHHLFPSVYTIWTPEAHMESDFKKVHAIDNIFDSQSGWGGMTANGASKGFTATCGQSVFRGDRLPGDMVGDLFFGEPVGRLVRRARWEADDMGRRVLANVYPGREFIRSTDANFRPVNSATGPDGTLYVVDMHQGIIQEAGWVPEGSFLHKAVKWYGLDQNAHNGRIYRVRHPGFELGPMPRMLEETPAQLVRHLRHPNGWWRDEAQKLVVLSGDKSVVPALKEMVASDDSEFGRLHALWTLEGLDAVDFPWLVAQFSNDDAKVRAASARISEPYWQADLSKLKALEPLVKDGSNEVLIQLLLSLSTHVVPESRKLSDAILAANPENTYLAEIDQGLNAEWFRQQQEKVRLAALNAQNRELFEAGKVHFNALCISCHGTDGKGMPNPALEGTTMAPSFVGSPRVIGRKETLVRIALDGMSGPIEGNSYPSGIMIPLKGQDDHYLASVLTYIRQSFGNKGEMVTPAEVAAVRRETLGRNEPYTQSELEEILLNADCPPALWSLSASHQPDDVAAMVDGDDGTKWWSKHEQKVGMWIEARFPHPRNLDTILMDARHGSDFPDHLLVEFSADGESWDKRIEAKGAKLFELEFEKTLARKVRISVASDKPKWWQVTHLEITGPTETDVEKYDPDRRVYLKIDDAVRFKQGWSDPKQDKSVLGHGLQIADEEFKHGIGTHSAAEFVYNLEGKGYRRFFAKCGPQGRGGERVMTFELHLDGEKVFDTGDMRQGEPAKFVDVNVHGYKQLTLVVTPGSDGETGHDHANWVDACFIKE